MKNVCSACLVLDGFVVCVETASPDANHRLDGDLGGRGHAQNLALELGLAEAGAAPAPEHVGVGTPRVRPKLFAGFFRAAINRKDELLIWFPFEVYALL